MFFISFIPLLVCLQHATAYCKQTSAQHIFAKFATSSKHHVNMHDWPETLHMHIIQYIYYNSIQHLFKFLVNFPFPSYPPRGTGSAQAYPIPAGTGWEWDPRDWAGSMRTLPTARSPNVICENSEYLHLSCYVELVSSYSPFCSSQRH